jgi:hypothetical protein
MLATLCNQTKQKSKCQLAAQGYNKRCNKRMFFGIYRTHLGTSQDFDL